MARHEHDREDLLREATALVQRVELQIAGEPAVVIGFRRDSSASLFVGGDLVFQFNSQQALRRGYWEGRLLKAEAGKLVALTRNRTSRVVQLLRRELDSVEADRFLQIFHDKRQAILAALASGKATIVGQVPRDKDVLGAAAVWLESLSDIIPIADRPHLA